MSKVLLTNNGFWDRDLRKIFVEMGFEENGRDVNKTFFTAYSKLNFKSENFYQTKNGFIGCAGTVIYKGMFGKNALKEIYDDLVKFSVQEIRQNIIGIYVLVYKRDDEIRIFVDETGSYAFYYYEKDGQYIFTNTYYHIQKMVKESIDKLAFLENELEYCILDERTPYNKIYRILCNEVFTININNNKVNVEIVNLNKYNENINNDIDDVAYCVNKIAKEVLIQTKDVLDTPYLFMTGGVDSRLILGNYLAIGSAPVLSCWFGAPITMNTKLDDYKAVNRIAETLGLDVFNVDVGKNDSDKYKEEISHALYEKLGEYATIYNGNDNWHDILPGTDIRYVDYGYFGETLKGWEALDELKEISIDLEGFIDIYINRIGIENIKENISYYQKLRCRITKEFMNISKFENINIEKLSKEDCMVLYYWYRLHADTVVYQYANFYCYSFPVYAQKRIADVINLIPYCLKQKNKLNLKMQYLMEPKLLDIPFYSHCKHMQFCSEKMELKDSYDIKIKNCLKAIIKKNNYIYKFSKVIRRNLKSSCTKNDCQENVLLKLHQSKTYQKLNINLKYDTIRSIPSLIKLSHACLMNDIIKTGL